MDSTKPVHPDTAVVSSPAVLLAAEGVSKRYGLQQVLRDVSLSFGAREVVLLLGANGAGKSTLLRVLAGLARPDRGRIFAPKNGAVGLASHHSFLYGRLSVRENISLFRSLCAEEQSSLDTLLATWDLGEVASRPFCELSKGNQTRASLARAFLGSPCAVLLDEPSSNLDQKSTERLLRVVATQAQSGLVVIATHDIHRLRDIATRVVVMEQGRVVADSGSQASAVEIDSVIQRYLEGNR
jgi:ABC-type multidrug transport system ATPase subunit